MPVLLNHKLTELLRCIETLDTGRPDRPDRLDSADSADRMLIVPSLAMLPATPAAAATASMASSTQPALYFGYGSNMWREQMVLRCPSSSFVGIGRLDGYRWQINERGYANVVELAAGPPAADPPAADPQHVAWGLIYALTAADEAALDGYEGVPLSYSKRIAPVHFWPELDWPWLADSGEATTLTDSAEPEANQTMMEMLAYVDTARVADSAPKEEYVSRMNSAIRDARRAGVPQDYIDQVLRRFIPPLPN